MQLNELDRFDAVVAELTEVFGKKLDEPMRRRYFETLRDVPLESVERMAREHMRDGKFFPKPRDLRPRERRQSADSDERGKSASKFPTAFSDAWWPLRVQMLKELHPQGVSAAARENLIFASLGRSPSHEERARHEQSYREAWPWIFSADRIEGFD